MNIDPFVEALQARAADEAKLVKTYGRSAISIEVIKIHTLGDDITELSKKKIDYIILMLNPADPTFLDRAEMDCARLHVSSLRGAVLSFASGR